MCILCIGSHADIVHAMTVPLQFVNTHATRAMHAYKHTCTHAHTHIHTHTHTHTHTQLSYYDSKQEGKCHGSIPLSDILGVEEADPTSVGEYSKKDDREGGRVARRMTVREGG